MFQAEIRATRDQGGDGRRQLGRLVLGGHPRTAEAGRCMTPILPLPRLRTGRDLLRTLGDIKRERWATSSRYALGDQPFQRGRSLVTFDVEG